MADMTVAEEPPAPQRSALTRNDLKQILFSCLRPAARVAEGLELSLADLQKLVELAYFQRALRSGRKKGSIGRMFGIGATKAADLSRELRAHFLEAEREHGLARQLLSLLWASPLTERQIVKALSTFDEREVRDALEQLLDEERVRRIPGRTERYAPTHSIQRLSVVPWMARVDGLNTLMDHISLAINARFNRRDHRAFVRNITFQVAPKDAEAMQAFYEDTLMPFILELDAKADSDPAPLEMKFSVLWAPDED